MIAPTFEIAENLHNSLWELIDALYVFVILDFWVSVFSDEGNLIFCGCVWFDFGCS